LKKTLQFLLLVILYNYALVAQNIQTDRPDQTETPALTPVGWLQGEAGFLSETNEGDVKYATYPSLLLKYGLNKNFELRTITEIASLGGQAGMVPFTFGFKVHFFDEKGLLPNTSLIAHIAPPKAGTELFHTTKWAPSFRFTLQNTLTEKLSLGYNLGAEWDGFSSATTWLYTLSFARSLGQKMGGYVETYGYFNENYKADNRLDAGLTYLISPNVQLDLSSGFGLKNSFLKHYAALGFSWRMPLKK
jgi:hypothetical protein